MKIIITCCGKFIYIKEKNVSFLFMIFHIYVKGNKEGKGIPVTGLGGP
jgi:hypothetical protein